MKKLSFYRPALACFVSMMSVALVTSGLSFFVSPVSEALGVGRGNFSLYFSLMAISGAFAAPVLGKMAGKVSVRTLMLLSGVWAGAGLFAFSFAGSLWAFYLLGFAVGLMGSVCTMLCVNVVLQGSYDAKTVSALTGIVMSGSGVGGMILSAVMPGILANLGWRNGYRFMGVAWLALSLLAVLILGKDEAPAQTAGKAETGAELGMTQAQMLKTPQMYMLLGEAAILAAVGGVQQHCPALLAGLGHDTAAVAAMMSLMTAALAIGKIGLGTMFSTAGVRVGGSVALCVYLGGLLLFAVGGADTLALVLTAVGIGVYTTLLPLVTRRVFGSYSFAAAWGMVQLGGSLGSFIGVPVWGAVYDGVGSYGPALIGAAVLLAVICGNHWVLNGEKMRVADR